MAGIRCAFGVVGGVGLAKVFPRVLHGSLGDVPKGYRAQQAGLLAPILNGTGKVREIAADCDMFLKPYW